MRIFFAKGIDQENLYKRISPNMIGFIDLVSKSSSMDTNSGSPSHSVMVRGRDLGKFLIKQRIIDDSLSVRDVERQAGKVSKRRLVLKRKLPAIMSSM